MRILISWLSEALTNVDKDYTKRELDMKFQELEKSIEGNHVETLERIGESDQRNHDNQTAMLKVLSDIKIQTTEHNHRMTKQETLSASIMLALKVMIPLIITIVSLIVYIYQYQLSQQTTRIGNLKIQVQSLQGINPK